MKKLNEDRRMHRMLSIVFIVLFAAVTLIASFPAEVNAAEAPYTPKSETTFNNPYGTPAEQRINLQRVDDAINATPAGATIRIAVYSFSSPSTADALIAAHGRGVNVKFLINEDASTWVDVTRLRAVFGTNRAARSFVYFCKDACMSNTPAEMHVKLFQFSTSGGANNVTMIGSGNLTTSSAVSQWNNMVTIVGSVNLYNFLGQYFSDMVADVSNPNYTRQLTDGIYTALLYPRPASSSKETDPHISMLSNVSCTGAASGYGSGGRTIIQIGMFSWTNARVQVAQKVAELHGKGCIIRVIVDAQSIEKEVFDTLLRRHTKYGVIPVYGVNRGANNIYIHHKYMLINGKYMDNTRSKHVITGSRNITNTGLRYGNELTLRVIDANMHKAFEDNFNLIRTQYSTLITKTPSSAAARTMNAPADAQRPLAEPKEIEILAD